MCSLSKSTFHHAFASRAVIEQDPSEGVVDMFPSTASSGPTPGIKIGFPSSSLTSFPTANKLDCKAGFFRATSANAKHIELIWQRRLSVASFLRPNLLNLSSFPPSPSRVIEDENGTKCSNKVFVSFNFYIHWFWCILTLQEVHSIGVTLPLSFYPSCFYTPSTNLWQIERALGSPCGSHSWSSVLLLHLSNLASFLPVPVFPAKWIDTLVNKTTMM